ncbi:MAG: beta-lactamase family protein [Chloroflexota bacterium]|nr:beta-lactamase family protein [Chloroflexota bacterium]
MTNCTCRPERADRRLTRRTTLQAAAGALAAALLTGPAQGRSASAQESPRTALPADLAGATPLRLTGALLAEFEAYIADWLTALGVPGAAVVVVQNGEVVLQQGYGVREWGKAEPVTADTLLRIGSVTKSFSSLLASTLIDDGIVTWDTPLVDLLPGFAVADAELTEQLTLRDAFCACTGVPRRDLEFMFQADVLTAEQIVATLAQLPLTAPFGEVFQYSNQMVAAGGFAAAMADGGSPYALSESYAVALRDRVLNPLGMKRTTLSLQDVVTDGDYAIPHAPDLENTPIPLSPMVDDAWIAPVGPTGGLWSTAREMAAYLQMELAHGVAPSGERLVSTENLEMTWQPGVPMVFGDATAAVFKAANSSYGLAWEVGNYGGLRLISHPGFTYGFNALVSFLPEAGIGIATLTNRDGAGSKLTQALQFRLFELVFSQPAIIDPLLEFALAGEATAREALPGQPGTMSVDTVTPYLGGYTNPDLGSMTLSLQDGKLIFTTAGARSALLPLLDDGGEITEYIFVDPPWASNPPGRSVSLVTGDDQRPEVTITIPGDGAEGLITYVYTRLAASEATPAP